jgi:hypothetical protein
LHGQKTAIEVKDIRLETERKDVRLTETEWKDIRLAETERQDIRLAERE